MTIASEVTRIKNNIESVYAKCEEKGGTLPETQDSNNLAACVESILALKGQQKTITENGVYTPDTGYNGFTEVTVNTPEGIIREVVSGVYQAPLTLNFTFKLPSSATDIAAYALQNVYRGCTGLTSVDFSSLTAISGYNGMLCSFFGCTGLTSVSLLNLATISGDFGMYSTFAGCTALSSIDLSSLLVVSGSDALEGAFNACTSLTSVDLSSLTTISGAYGMAGAFQYCINLTSVNLSSLSTLKAPYAMGYIFDSCESLVSLSFPALKSTSFGTNTNQFNRMLNGVTGCTVHFPSNLQSVISSWSDVVAGFGGTNTIVLFDLPATS